jgi:UDPglucose 6-dehydrogenase
MKISVIGTGYVGLVTGVCLADKGHTVVCVDVDLAKIEKINQGIPPIYEKGLEDLLKKNIHQNLCATSDLHQAVMDSEVTMIAVGTPFNGSEIDLTYIKEVSRQIGETLKVKPAYHTVVVKSTVIPGTTDQVVQAILEEVSGKKAGVDFGVGMNPEFLTEGVALRDFMFPDRIVLGGIDERTIHTLEEVYAGFQGVDVVRTNNKTAEMIKYTSNALLATMISFSNEVGNLCSALGGIDVVDVMEGVHKSMYLSPKLKDGSRVQAPITSFLEAGCGFGGSCLPKDVSAIVAQGKSVDQAMPLLDSVLEINHKQYLRMIALLKKHYPSLEGLRVCVLGLAFKPDTDDMRESPAIPLVAELLAQKAIVKAYDPVAMHEAQKRIGDKIEYCDSLEQALANSQAVLLVTRWDEFQQVPELLAQLDQQPVFIDGRRVIDRRKIARYEGIGL